MFHLIGHFLFFIFKSVIHLPFALVHMLQRAFFHTDFEKMSCYDFEEYAASYLRHHGYSHVSVTKASHDFGVDILAAKHHTTYAVQCKLYQGKVGNSAIQEAVAGKSYYDCEEAMVITNSTFYPGAVALAEANNVTLIDGEIIRTDSWKIRRFCKTLFLLLLLGFSVFLIAEGMYTDRFIRGLMIGILGIFFVFCVIHIRKKFRQCELWENTDDGSAIDDEPAEIVLHPSPENTAALSKDELELFMAECERRCRDEEL